LKFSAKLVKKGNLRNKNGSFLNKTQADDIIASLFVD